MSEYSLSFFYYIYSRGGKLPKLSHDNITKIRGGDKAEIPRCPLLQLHFQAHELIPTSISCLGCLGLESIITRNSWLFLARSLEFLIIQIEIYYYKV